MRKTILLSAMSLGLVCFVLSSCSEGTTEEKRMSSAVEEISFPKEGGSERIAILAEGIDSLNAYATESWIDIEVDNGNSSVVVSAAPTDEISGLSGKVFVYADIEQMLEIDVSQEGNGIIYERSSLDIMGLHGPVQAVDFYFSPKNLWLMQTQYLSNLEFDENGMLIHYEYSYVMGSSIDFTADISYDDQNRPASIQVASNAAAGSEFPQDMTIDFIYGDHGKYISMQHIFTVAEAWNCPLWQSQWMPRMLRNLSGIRLTSDFIAGYIGTDNVSVDIGVDGDSGEAVYTMGDESYVLETYSFTGDYTTGMVYDINFVGIVIPSYITYEIDPESGYISRFIQRNDEVYGVLSEEVYSLDVQNSLISYTDNYQNYSRLLIEYNESLDPISVVHENYGYVARFGYSYDDYGNWVELDVLEMTEDPLQKLQTTRTVTYYSTL